MALKGYRDQNLMKIRDSGSSDCFMAFVHFFLQHTIPKTNWMSGRSTMKISELFTPVDEAFAILLMINHWMEWEHLASGKSVDRQNKLTLYTHCYKEEEVGGSASTENSSNNSMPSCSSSTSCASSSSKKSRENKKPPKVKGWSNEGIRKYTEICKHIQKVRSSDAQRKMEDKVLDHYIDADRDAITGRQTRKRRRNEVDEAMDEEPFSMYQLGV